MKQAYKDIIKKELTSYLEKNNIIIESSIYSSDYYHFKRNAENKSLRTSVIEYVTSGTKIHKISDDGHLFSFAKELLMKTQDKELILAFFVDKEPPYSYYDQSKYENKILKFLKNYKEIYFNYVSRNKFLLHHFKKNDDIMEEMFKVVESQDKREEIIERCLTLKTFSELDNKTFLYKLIQENIVNKKKYDEFFTSILSKEEDVSFYNNKSKQEVITFNLDMVKLNAVNLDNEFGVNGIKTSIRYIANKIPENGIPSLNINEVVYEDKGKNKNDIQIRIYGNDLNFEKIDLFFTYLIKEVLLHPGRTNVDEQIKEALTTTMAKLLEDELSTKDTIKPKSNKI